MSQRDIIQGMKGKPPILWNRRHFLQVAGSTSLLGLTGGRFATAQEARFAYIGTHNALHVYKISAQGLIKEQTLAAARPAALKISNHHLYVANEVALSANLPCGSVEAYEINVSTGRLQRKNRILLSLSATLPRDLAVAPGGRNLLVAVHGGGAYNLLPVNPDGSLGKVSGILKSIGSGPHPQQASAHPAAILFDPAGRAFSADQGSDTLHRLSLKHGELRLERSHSVVPGGGPGAMALHPDKKQLYVANALNGTLSSFSYDEDGSLILRHTVQASARAGTASLAIHPGGASLYSALGNSVQTWTLAQDGTLQQTAEERNLQATRLSLTADGGTLFAVAGDAIFRMQISLGTGRLTQPSKVAAMANPLSIALL